MSSFPGSPKLLKGGIALLDPDTLQRVQLVALQYNPDTLSRTLQVQGVASEGGDRSEPLRLKGPPVETYKVDIEIDATDQLEHPDQNPTSTQVGIYPQLAVLETMIYPTSATLQLNDTLAQSGTVEIAPAETWLIVFIWSPNRVMPVRITEFSIHEEAFDPQLNPIRAKISLGMRVLSVNDFKFGEKGASLYMAYQQQKERLAAMAQAAPLSAVGVTGFGS